MTDRLMFYTNPMSRGRIARWMLEECQADYDTVIVEYGPSMKSGDYLAINPMGKVPALKHGDSVVTECAAVCTYLADLYPEANLAPPLDRRAAYYRWLFFAAGPVEAAVTDKSLGVDVPEDKRSMVGYGHLPLVVDTLEAQCRKHPFLIGETFSTVDVYLGSQIAYGLHFGTLEKRPAFEDYCARITNRDAYRQAKALDDAAMQQAEAN